MSTYKPQGFKKLFHDTRRFLAKKWLSIMPALQIGITGSHGKTNTTLLVAKVLEAFGPTVATDINLDTIFNVPITAFKVMPWTKYVVWELGIDTPQEMDYHLEIAKPTIGIVTGISPVHTDYDHLGSMENLIKEKRKLIEILPAHGYAILNGDDANVKSMSSQTKTKTIFYGISAGSNVQVDNHSLKVSLDGTSFKLNDEGETYEIQTGLIGVHHIYTVMAGYCLLKAIKPENNFQHKFIKVVKKIKPLQGRMNLEKGPMNTLLLNDSLRANPDSTRAGLETLEQIPYTKGRKIAVIGEMGELDDPVSEHKKTGIEICKLKLDYVLCIGPLRRYTVKSAIENGFSKERIGYADDIFEAADRLKKLLKPNNLWYLKGSLLRNYKRIVQLLNGEKVCCDRVLCPYEHCGY
ncbi:hypothetical protein A3F59_00515 [Candidatus Roizmanbacteria bacterium RIFCSPHIGHO2_12_FULL_38_13]|nr:MAG: hypothetical protein A3F59_00515 [Candidatus Roizmanbacteria bacterium RIFCSPHIGHO2_12_FULL_38_13]